MNRTIRYRQPIFKMICVIVALMPAFRNANAGANDLATQAHAILKARCYSCHGEKHQGNADLNVLKTADLVEQGYLVGGDANKSYLFERILEGEMPPDPKDQLSQEEIDVIGNWIAAGAPQASAAQRTLIRNHQIIQVIYDDLLQAIPSDRQYYRYFSLAHLHNNVETFSDRDLRMFRAAFSKMLNSVSRNPNIVVPQTIDPAAAVFRVDIRRLDWNAKQWNRILKRYPYGFNLQHSANEHLADIDRQIEIMTGTHLCWIRADWFVSKASRAPLYNELLDLPTNLADLEASLGIDVDRNINDGTAQRAGFVNSGVSTGHRLLERHRSRDGYYWKSFDFQPTGISRDVMRMPLGPKKPNNKFNRFAFEHDGGEIIFSLPNGLQAYMLADNKDQRIDRAPIEIVRDIRETGGTPQVINAVSCINCHRHGILPFKDAVRESSGLFGQARVKVRQLFPKQEVMDIQVDRDRRIFMNALAQATEPFLLQGDDREQRLDSFDEPVGQMVRVYDRSLSRLDLASELGVPASELRLGREQIRMGLGPAMQGGTIKRQYWASLEMFVSPYQQTIQSLGIATPVR